MEHVLVLSADRWAMQDEKTGKPMGGVSIWFVNDYREPSEDSVGLKPTKVGAPAELWASLRTMRFPAVCELAYSSRPGPGGKAALVLTAVKVVREVDVFAAPTGGAKK